MATQFRILRPFRAGGRMRNPTDAPVDGSEFTNVRVLVDQRYIAPTDSVLAGNIGHTGPTPDPKIAEDAARELAAGRDIEPGKNVGDEQSPGDGKGESTATSSKSLRGKLPEEFPGHKALIEAGFDTYAKVRRQLDTLEDIDGIGKATAEKIRAEFDGETVDESEEETKAAPPTGDSDALAEDFPGFDKLSEAGVKTYGDVRSRLETLEDIEGIGPATADAIREIIEALGTGE